MKHIASIHALLAALCLAAPVSSMGAPDGHDGFHGRFFHRRPRVFVGGAPIFWGPAIGFSFYGGPTYYPGYESQEGPDRPAYRGTQRAESEDDLGMDVQRALTHEGYYHGPIDGEIGSGSRAAIRAYQSDHGLEVTGRMDGMLLRSLHID